MLDIEDREGEILVVTKIQAKKLAYPDATTETERFQEAKKDIQARIGEEGKTQPETSTSSRGVSNIVRQMLETTILVKISDLLEILLQL